MNKKDMQIIIWPTTAPTTAEILYEVDFQLAVHKIFRKLAQADLLAQLDSLEEAQAYVFEAVKSRSFIYHIELSIGNQPFDWQPFLKKLQDFLPQFIWLSVRMRVTGLQNVLYYFEFIPLVIRDSGAPFDFSLQESLQQQLAVSEETAKEELNWHLERIIIAQQLLAGREGESSSKTAEENPLLKATKAQKITAEMKPVENELLLYQEESKREKYAKDRLKITNEKLELIIAELEAQLYRNGVDVANSNGAAPEKNKWYKFVKIDLREYAYLLKKAQALESILMLNQDLMKKAHVSNYVPEKQPFNKTIDTVLENRVAKSTSYLFLAQCNAIEARTKIHLKPFLKKPYAKILRLDYEDLIQAATYFDILQSESHFLENHLSKQRQVKTKPSQEDG